MKAGLSLSIYNDCGLTAEDLKRIKDAGFDGVEITLTFHHMSEDELIPLFKERLSMVKASGLECFSVHLPYGGRHDISVEELTGAAEEHKKYIDIASEYGVPRAILHPSAEPIADEERDIRIACANKRIKEIAEYAAEKNVQIAVECLPRTCVGNCADECIRLVEGTKADICMDINHLFKETPSEFIEKLGDKIITTHISDCDGIDERHLLPGKGVIDFRKAFTALRNDIPLNLELRTGEDVYPESAMEAFKNVTKEYVAGCDQVKNQIVVYDTADFNHVHWSWRIDDIALTNISGVKLRQHKDFGKVMLVVASGGYAGMVSYPQGEVLWHTYTQANLHSIELLPDGRIAIAASDENYVRVYAPLSQKYQEIACDFPHGVLFDPKRNSLWILEKKVLREFDAITLLPDGNRYDFEESLVYGHDLSPYYGNKNLFWITVENGAYLYDKTLNKAVKYEQSNYKSVKGVGNTPFTDTVFAVFPNGTYKPWCSDRFSKFSKGKEEIIIQEGMAFYKLRVFHKEYQ